MSSTALLNMEFHQDFAEKYAAQCQEKRAETEAINARFFEALNSNDGEMIKDAQDTIDNFTRYKMREQGFYRQNLPPLTIQPSDLDRQASTHKPSKVVDLEVDSPASITVGFGTGPDYWQIRGRRYVVTLNRILSPAFQADLAELMTWEMDIRQVLSDNALRDMLAAEDTTWVNAMDRAVGTVDTETLTAGSIQHKAFPGGITRDSWLEGMSLLPQTISRFQPKQVLFNVLTANQLMKLDGIEIGGNLSEEMFRKGWVSTELFGVRCLITIKTDLVDTGVFYWMADPTGIGKHYMLTSDTQMFMERKAYMLTFFAYQCSGGAIGNTNAIAKSVHTGY